MTYRMWFQDPTTRGRPVPRRSSIPARDQAVRAQNLRPIEAEEVSDTVRARAGAAFAVVREETSSWPECCLRIAGEGPMDDKRKRDETALHSEVMALKKRIDVLESRVTELERELRETQETAPSD